MTAAARLQAAREKNMTEEQLAAEEASRVIGPARYGLTGLWLRPVRGPFDRAAKTADKPIGELTIPEALDWATILGYAGLTGYVIGRMAANLLEVMLGGRRH